MQAPRLQLAVALAAAAGLAVADEPSEKSCAVISRASNGAPMTTQMAGLEVIGQTAKDGEFRLPAGAPKDVEAVICKRSSIVPAEHDDKVLRAGYTLYVTDDLGRVAALGIADGNVRLNVLDGALTDAEQSAAGARMSEFRARFRRAD